MNETWKGEFYNAFWGSWGWLLWLPLVWLPLRLAVSFAASEGEKVEMAKLLQPAIACFGLAAGALVTGFLSGWVRFATGSDYSKSRPRVVIQAMKTSAVIFCFLTAFVLTAIGRLSIENILDLVVGLGAPGMTVLKEWWG